MRISIPAKGFAKREDQIDAHGRVAGKISEGMNAGSFAAFTRALKKSNNAATVAMAH
jgi:hypothetical protein